MLFLSKSAVGLNGGNTTPQTLRELRRALRDRDRLLEQKEAELQNLLFTLTHELKTPIGAIRGFTQFILEEFDDGLPELVIDYLERIVKNVDRIEVILEDLNLLSKLNIHEDSFEVINIRDLISDILLELYGQYPIEASTVAVAEDLPAAFGHRGGIQHVFINLISNAFKYRRQRVPLQIEIGCSEDEFFLKYYVRDNGIGIPKAAQRKIFDMFVRVGSKKHVQGSGLGLYIVRRIVQAHGGEVWVRSQKGRGSTFYFTLPKPPARV